MKINRKILMEKGYYLIKLLVLLSLANLFLGAILSFATSIKLAKTALMKKSNYTALKSLMANDIRPKLDGKRLDCASENLTKDLEFSNCLEKQSNQTIQFLNNKYEGDEGFSLIELLVYLLLSGILLSVISNSFHALSRPYKSINEKFIEEEKLKSLEDKLGTSIYKNTLNKFLPIHYWHNQLSLPDHISKRIDKLSATSRPNVNSAILELLDTEPSLFLRSTQNSYRYKGSINKSSLIGGGIKAWLSPEPLGNILVLAKPKTSFLMNNITEIGFTRNEIFQSINILTKTQVALESNPALLIAVRDHYLLYTTSTNTLRRVSLLSSENQPLLEGVMLEAGPPNSCIIRLKSSKASKQILCENNQVSILMRLHAIDL